MLKEGKASRSAMASTSAHVREPEPSAALLSLEPEESCAEKPDGKGQNANTDWGVRKSLEHRK